MAIAHAVSAVPEPSSIALVATALPMGLGLVWKRRHKTVNATTARQLMRPGKLPSQTRLRRSKTRRSLGCGLAGLFFARGHPGDRLRAHSLGGRCNHSHAVLSSLETNDRIVDQVMQMPQLRFTVGQMMLAVVVAAVVMAWLVANINWDQSLFRPTTPFRCTV